VRERYDIPERFGIIFFQMTASVRGHFFVSQAKTSYLQNYLQKTGMSTIWGDPRGTTATVKAKSAKAL
jgi:hypothetical protein